MKIIEKEINECKFGDLKCGEVFKDEHGTYCMKTMMFPCGNDGCNHVSLETGYIYGTFHNDDIVTKVDCELLIK